MEKIEKNVSREQVAMARDIGKHPESGKPMSVRMGQYGPFVQIGTKDDEEKPKFAGLRPGQKMDTITIEQALELFKLPRTLGQTAEARTSITNVGRFGPYIKYGAKYVSLKEDDPYTVELPRALELIRLKQEADANRIIADFRSESLQVLNGRFGPVCHQRQEEREDPEGSRSQVDHARRSAGDDRAGARAWHRPVRARQARRSREDGSRAARRRRKRGAPSRQRPRKKAATAAGETGSRGARTKVRAGAAPSEAEGRGEHRAQGSLGRRQAACAQDGAGRIRSCREQATG